MSLTRLHVLFRPGAAMRRCLLFRHEGTLQSDLRSQTSSARRRRGQSPSRPSQRVDSLGNCRRPTSPPTRFDVTRRSRQQLRCTAQLSSLIARSEDSCVIWSSVSICKRSEIGKMEHVFLADGLQSRGMEIRSRISPTQRCAWTAVRFSPTTLSSRRSRNIVRESPGVCSSIVRRQRL